MSPCAGMYGQHTQHVEPRQGSHGLPEQVPCCETRRHGSGPWTPGGNQSLSSTYGRCLFFWQISSGPRGTRGAAGMPAPLPAAQQPCLRAGTPAWTPAVSCSTRTRRPEEGFPLLASPPHLHAATSLQLQGTEEFFLSPKRKHWLWAVQFRAL